jgi:endo-beta-N-acetylglucosaminidase D
MKRATVTMQKLAPTLLPIETIADLKNWRSQGERSNIAKIPLANRTNKTSLPIPSLMGFDMGEFTFDPWFTLWSQGAEGTGADGNRTAANVYNFSYWQYVDISYYFTHSLVTIPPTVWTNACHKNGVPSLGTVYLNVEEGNKDKITDEDVRNFLTKKPANPDPKKMYLEDAIQTLSDVATYFGFDGYLINQEDENTDLIPGMLALLSALKGKGCRIIWYDSPFSGGGDFQNRLTQGAYKFLAAAGYFQANYWWRGTDKYPESSWKVIKKNSKSPLTDRDRMFMAMDSAAERKTPPYGSSDNAFFGALDSIKSQRNPPGYFTGLGVYYPAWDMYDLRLNNTGHNTDKLPDRDMFHANDQAFWTGTKESVILLNKTKKKSTTYKVVPITAEQCMKTYVKERSVITSLPFVTWFNNGEGDFYNIEGVTVSTGSWNNLSDQSVLPTYRFFFDYEGRRRNKTAIAHPTSDLVFTGGSCLSVDFDGQPVLEFALFKTKITLPAKSRITFVRKQTNVSLEKPILTTSDGVSTNLAVSQTSMHNGWDRLAYDLPPTLAGKVVTEIGLQLTAVPDGASYYLGQFRFLDTTGVPASPKGFDFPNTVEELDWTNGYQDTSHYRVWGFLNPRYYLIGIVYNSVYRVRYGPNEANHIFNPTIEGFTAYRVLEVDKFGNA